MKFVHLSDTHLGYHSYRKLTSEGYNQREEDVRQAFVRAVDKTIELKPDFCVHSGDLFDSPRPSNRNISLAISEFLRLTENGIPIVVISGNHETPKTRHLGHVFSVFDFFSDVYPVYQPHYVIVRLGRVAIHAIPQCPSAQLFEEELKKLAPVADADYNLLTLHAGIANIPEFSRGDFNEQFVDQDYFRGFDWVALGHYHNFAQLQPNVMYAGSPERFSFAEATNQKGFPVVDLETGKARFVQTEAREMLEVIINASQLPTANINDEIQTMCESIEPSGKIVKFKVEGLDSSASKLIDFKRFFDLTKEALHSAIEVIPRDGETTLYSPSPQLSKLSDEFKLYLEKLPNVDQDTRREMESLGLHYLSLVEETESD
jgi:DNA repair exonuclease SbcCD nuclease subunit